MHTTIILAMHVYRQRHSTPSTEYPQMHGSIHIMRHNYSLIKKALMSSPIGTLQCSRYVFHLASSGHVSASSQTTFPTAQDLCLRRLLNIVGYSTSAVTPHRRLLNIVGDSSSSTLSTIGIRRLIQKIQDYQASSVTRPHRLLDLTN
jgi:hypothetical protein